MAFRVPIVLSAFLLLPTVSSAEPFSLHTGVLAITRGGSLFFDHANTAKAPMAGLIVGGTDFSTNIFATNTSLGTFPSLPEWNPAFESGGVMSGTLRVGGAVLQLGGGTSFMEVRFTAPLVRIPPGADRNFFAVDYPFQLSGRLFGHTLDNEAFSFDLIGDGTGQTVYVGLVPVLTGLSFAPSAPIPEPGTLLLVASGGALVLRQARRKRDARAS